MGRSFRLRAIPNAERDYRKLARALLRLIEHEQAAANRPQTRSKRKAKP